MTSLPPVLNIVVVFIVVTAGVYDIRYRRIPNWLIVIGLAAGIGLNVLLTGLSGLWSSFGGLGLALLIYSPLYLVRGMGAGDVKLMGVVGGIVGPLNWLGIFIMSAILGGLIGIILLISKGRLSRTVQNVVYMLKELVHLRPPYVKREELDISSHGAITLPHGAVAALGAMIYLAWLSSH